MTQYCFVENGSVQDGPRRLPSSWRNISRLDLLPADKLADLGWLPVEESKATIDPLTEAAEAPVLEIADGKVTRTIGKRDLPAEEAAARQAAKDAEAMKEAGKDLALITVELIEKLLADKAFAATDFSPPVRASFQDIKAIADRMRA